jgi:hypothetical protein
MEESSTGTISVPGDESALGTPLPSYTLTLALPNVPRYTPQPPDPALLTPWSSGFSLGKDELAENSAIDDLDADGFTAAERREHERSLRYIRSLRAITMSRLLIRFLSILVSGTAFILIAITIILFAKYMKTHTHLQDPEQPNHPLHLNFSPTTFFTSVSAIFTIVSLSINILCCLMPKLRTITPLSNIVFCIVSVVGTAGWLTGCLFLQNGRGGVLGGKQNFWYFVCDAARDYQSGTEAGPQSQEMVQFCNYTTNSWALGVLQLCFEILTFLNVVVAWILVKSGVLRMARM